MAYDYGGYERARGDIDYKYSTDSTNNAYGRFISQQRGSRQLGDMTRGFQRQYPRNTASFAQRGVAGGGVKSGIMNEAMNRYIGDYTRDYGRAQQDITQGLQQYDLNQANLNQWRKDSISGLEAQKANEIARAAEGIQYIKQMLGSL